MRHPSDERQSSCGRFARTQRFVPPVLAAFGFLLASTVAASLAFGQQPGAAPDPPSIKRTATNLTRFGIPFSVSDPDDNYIEVQLYYSRDRGQSWQFYGRQSTAARDFPFQTDGDGTYSFALRTLDRDRQLHPSGEMKPELEVTVDTVDPVLDFRIQTDAAGRLVCRWRAEDADLDVAATQLSFRPLISIDDRENTWIPVPYKAITEPVDQVFTDQYAFWPETNAREVLVQLVVVDRAGNKTFEERQVLTPRMAYQPGNQSTVTRGSQIILPRMDIPNSGIEIVSGPPVPPQLAVPLPPQMAAPPTVVSQPEIYGTVIDALRPDFSNPESTERQPTGSGKIAWGQPQVQRPEASGEGWPQRTDERPVMNLSADQAQPVQEAPADPVAPSTSLSPLAAINPPREAEPRMASPSNSAGGPETTPFHQANFTPITETAPGASHSVIESQTSSDSRRCDSINSRRFRMRYELDRLTPADISKVVLWFTADEGRTWTAYGEDPDNVSPFPVEMPGPGLYGLRVVFHTVDGLQGRPPASGDDADYWVRVDLEHPVAKLTAAPYGTGAEAGALVVHWTAEDELLAARPIKLSYSTFASGPWTMIAAGIENTGKYAWTITKDIPEQVYLQLEVTDAAGNVTRNQTNAPIDLSGLIPKARILGVESVK